MIIKPRYAWAAIAAILILCLASFGWSSRAIAQRADAPVNSEAVYLPIIVYHEVKTKLTSYTILPYEFENDLKYLQKNHYTAITMDQLINYVYSGTPLPEKPIILSFDDGYLNNYKYVFPLLKKYNTKIVFSIVGKNTDDFTRIPDDNLDYSHVTWEQLKEMHDSGLVDVQNHTYNLHSNKKGRVGCMQMSGESDAHYEQTLSEDLLQCQKEINEAIGVTPNTFTYPYGRISPNTDGILKKLGFKATLSCNYGVNVIQRNPETLYALRRICRIHGTSLEKALSEGMKTLKYRKPGNN